MSRLCPVLITAASAMALACANTGHPADDAKSDQARTPRAAEPPPPPPGPQPKVYVTGKSGEVAVVVEIARTEPARQRGLMYRQHLPPDDGMLFLMDTEQVQSFWMQNTLIPLDMLFIGRDLKVACIVERAEPRTTSHQECGKVSVYVLEVNGGWVAEHGVAAGNAVRFENIDLTVY